MAIQRSSNGYHIQSDLVHDKIILTSKITLSYVAGVAIGTTPHMQIIDHFRIES
jgi:hypothetical protein